MKEALRLITIDDHGLCRRGLTELLELQPGIKVLASTGNPAEAVELIRQHTPDLVIMDLRMPMMDGVTLLRHLRNDGIDTPVMILTMSDAQEDMANALGAGARGYLLKDMCPDDVVESIARCARGELVVAPAMAAKLANLLHVEQPGMAKEKSVRLTEREREILQFVAGGRTNKEIAKALHISQDTVKLHVRHILAKLKLTSRVEAAVFAVEHGVSPRHHGNPL
jgi:two-component system nitrate/nitrite response regulator NarL